MSDPPSEQSLDFLVLGQRVRIDCAGAAVRALLGANFEAMAAVDGEGEPPALRYAVRSTAAAFSIARAGGAALTGVDLDDLLFALEKDLTLELQKRRPELLFLHSAAVEWQGKAYLFAAEAGSGKSTTAWALLHHGFRYLSDELSPIALDALAVLPYAHALCLKQPPPEPYALPAGAIHLGRTIHVPTAALPGSVASGPRPLGAVFLLRHEPKLRAPNLRELGAAEASARLYVTALNVLAHPDRGLDAVARIAARTPCFALESADLASTCSLIRSVVA
jgi:hypothetical protein